MICNVNAYEKCNVTKSPPTPSFSRGGFYICLPLLRGNVACDKGVKIPLPSASPFKKGEQFFLLDKGGGPRSGGGFVSDFFSCFSTS